MIEFKRKSCILIPKNLKGKPLYEDVKAFLTHYIKNFVNSTIIKCEFYYEDNKGLRIPRFFPVNNFIKYENEKLDFYLNNNNIYNEYNIIDESHIGENINIENKIELRNDLQKNTVEYMLNNDNGIIQLSPGSGKTVISIYVICKRKKKSLIIVHRNSLVEQWKERFLQFTNLNEDDICIFNSSKLDFSHPITISTVQTLLSCLKRQPVEFINEINKSNIGICISDESHTSVGAEAFSKVSLFIPSKVIFGLSATPFRNDGTEDIMKYHLGEIYHPIGDSQTMDAEVTFILFDYGLLKKSYKYIFWGGSFQLSRYLNLIKNSELFISICKSIISKTIKDDRNVIFISERIKLIDLLYKDLNYKDKSKFIKNEKNDKLNSKIVFATPSKIRDGIDIPKKDCLIMTSPIGNIEQLSGRIVRTYPNKKTPIILDMVDIGVKQIYQRMNLRIKYYKDKNWKIKYIFINNKNEKEIIDENKVKEIFKK